MQIYLLGLFLLILAAAQVYIVRLVIGRRRAGEPWLARGPDGARREPVYKTAPKPKPAKPAAAPAAPIAAVQAAGGVNAPRAAFTAGSNTAVPQPPTKLPPRPKAAPQGAVAPDVEARLEWAFDLLQTSKIPLESYVRIVEAERDQARVKLARLREAGNADEAECAGLESSLEVFGWCLEWASSQARTAA